MKVIVLIKFILILHTMVAIAQNQMKHTLDQLKLKKKHQLIQIGLDIIKEKQPYLVINADDFEISVFDTNQDILVDWKRKVTFIPIKSRCKGDYQYDISLSLIQKCITKSYFSEVPHTSYLEEGSLFVLSDEDLKIIEIGQEEYNLGDRTGQIYIVEYENDYTIIHINDFFSIRSNN